MRFIILFSLFALGLSTYAQQDTIKSKSLSEVEIAATHRPSTSLSATPLQVLTDSDIKKQGIQSLTDAVKRFNGVVLKDYGGIGGLKTISIRGLGAEYTAISYDGLMVNNLQSGQVDISRFNLDNISMLTLSIGQNDNIYQSAKSFASAGVLSLETKHPLFLNSDNEAHTKITTGSFGHFEPMISYAYKASEQTAITAHINWQRVDGKYPFTEDRDVELTDRKRKNSDVNTLRSEINIYNKLSASDNLDIKLYFYNSEMGLPGAVTFYVDDSQARVWDKNAFAQIAYNKKFNDRWKLKSQVKYDYTYTKNTDFDIVKTFARYRQNEVFWSNSAMYSIIPTLSVSLSQDLSYNSLRSSFQPFNSGKAEPNRWNSYTALATQYKVKRLTLTASALATYVKEKIKEKSDKDKTFKKMSPSFSASYQPFEKNNWRVRGSYKHVYRIPTFTELYYVTTSNGLDAESSSQYNVGTTWVGAIQNTPIEYLNLSIDAYYNNVKDKIIIFPYPIRPSVRNAGKVKMKGVDAQLSANIRLVKDFSLDLTGAYSYMDAYDADRNNRNTYKHQLPYTPKHSGSATITINNPWINLSYNMLFSDVRYSSSENLKDNKLKSYTDHSISAFKEMKINDYELYANGTILNLLNKNYSVINYYPMPGRSFRISVGCKF